jgi:hypothetical protein
MSGQLRSCSDTAVIRQFVKSGKKLQLSIGVLPETVCVTLHSYRYRTGIVQVKDRVIHPTPFLTSRPVVSCLDLI